MATPETRRARRDAERNKRSGRQAVLGGLSMLALGTLGFGYILSGSLEPSSVVSIPSECTTTQRVKVVTDPSMAAALSRMPVNPQSCIVMDAVGDYEEAIRTDRTLPDISAGLWIPPASDLIPQDDTSGQYSQHTASLASSPAVVVSADSAKDFPTWTGVLSDPSIVMADARISASAHVALRSVVGELDRQAASVPQVRRAVTARAARIASTPEVATLTDQELLTKAQTDSDSVVVTEHAYLDYLHSQTSSPRLQARVPATGSAMLNYPLMVPTQSGQHNRTVARAADEITSFFATDAGRNALGDQHLRSARGERVADSHSADVSRTLQPDSPEVWSAVLSTWAHKTDPLNAIYLVDTSASMAQKNALPGGITPLTTAASSMSELFQSLPASDHVRIWTPSSPSNARSPAHELVPGRSLNEEVDGKSQRDLAIEGLNRVKVTSGSSSGLYESTLAAFREASANYQPHRTNVVYVITDASTDRGGSMSLDRLVDTLRREQSREHPVKIVTIALTSGDVPKDLAKIAEATQGTTHTAASPEELQRAFQDALVMF